MPKHAFLTMLIAVLGAYAPVAAQAPGEQRECPIGCLTIWQVFPDTIHEVTKLNCESSRSCGGSGSFEFGTERVPAKIAAAITNDVVVVTIKNGKIVFVPLGESQIVIGLIPNGTRQSAEFRLEGVVESWLPDREKPYRQPLPPVARQGIRVPGFVRIEYEKPTR